MAMDEKRAGQVATAGLIFGLLGFIMVVVLGVYIVFYDSNSDATPIPDPKMAMPMYRAPPMVYRAPPPRQQQQPQQQQHMLSQPPYQSLPANTYAAPPIPHTVASGVVGTFFDDELPQA
jgi:hypothetical protein